jgi:hypothetical protein
MSRRAANGIIDEEVKFRFGGVVMFATGRTSVNCVKPKAVRMVTMLPRG